MNIDLKAVATGKQQTWLPAKEVKKLLGISKVALHNSRGRFVTKQALSNGGAQYLFLLSSLPGDAQASIYRQSRLPFSPPRGRTHRPPTSYPLLFSRYGAGTCPPPAPSSSAIPEKLKTIALARFDLVTAWKAHRLSYIRSKRRLKADEDFESAYNSGLLLPAIFERIGKADVTTVKRWHRKLEGTSDWTRLAPMELSQIGTLAGPGRKKDISGLSAPSEPAQHRRGYAHNQGCHEQAWNRFPFL